ncbi:MAG: hypothetical protein KDA32_09885 [Phycisphaerales bacterium]|nr:hypothetical protein [Phycisphaerales bacterium]
MELDDDICYCYHVSLRKLINFARREQPTIPSRMSECLGAGTGCGWCIPILCKIAEAAREGRVFAVEMTPEEYGDRRREYRKGGDKNRFEGGAGASDFQEALGAGRLQDGADADAKQGGDSRADSSNGGADGDKDSGAERGHPEGERS